jgi:predicted DNA-binding transcriptional regulator AlpA
VAGRSYGSPLPHNASVNNAIDRPWDLVGRAEIAEELGVSRSTPWKWSLEERDFPEPIAALRMGAIFDRLAVLAWYEARALRRTREAPR